MGCWNGTCALSNLPILEEDKIVLIPIIGKGTSYEPIGLPIRGYYNDYGMIESITNPEVADVFYQRMNEALNKKWISIEDTDRYKTDYETVEELLSLIERELVSDKRVRYEGDIPRFVNFVMMHESIYDKVILSQYSSDVKEQLDDMVKEYDSLMDTKKDDLDTHGEILFNFTLDNVIGMNLAFWFDSDLPNKTFIPKYYLSNRVDSIESALMDFIFIKRVFEEGRLSWIPVPHRGSQSQGYDINEVIYKEALNLVETAKHRWD